MLNGYMVVPANMAGLFHERKLRNQASSRNTWEISEIMEQLGVLLVS